MQYCFLRTTSSILCPCFCYIKHRCLSPEARISFNLEYICYLSSHILSLLLFIFFFIPSLPHTDIPLPNSQPYNLPFRLLQQLPNWFPCFLFSLQQLTLQIATRTVFPKHLSVTQKLPVPFFINYQIFILLFQVLDGIPWLSGG